MVSNGLTLINELPEDRRPPLRDAVKEDAVKEDAVKEDAVKEDAVKEDAVAEENPSDSVTKQAEIDNAQEQPQTPQQENSAEPVAESICYRIGGIETKSDLEGLLSRLKKNDATDIKHKQHQVNEENYWVILPPYPNRKRANDAAEILNRKRIKDFFIVRTGEHENAISLGVYSTRERAMVRYEQIANLKGRLRKPEIESLNVQVSHYEVSYKVVNSTISEHVSAYLRRQKMSAAEEIQCK